MTSFGTQLATAFLAAPPTPPPGKGAEWGKAAPIGLLILVLLGVALYLLIKSMNRHMRKVSGLTSFDATVGPEATVGAAVAADAAGEDPVDTDRAGPAATVVAGPDDRQSPADLASDHHDPKT